MQTTRIKKVSEDTNKILIVQIIYKKNLSNRISLFSDECDAPLGMESGTIPDEAITASSSYVPNVGPKNGRYRDSSISLLSILDTYKSLIVMHDEDN